MNASETVFLIECVKDIPIGTRLWVSVLFPRGFELADFEVEATIIWKELLLKEDWEGYEYRVKYYPNLSRRLLETEASAPSRIQFRWILFRSL